MQQNPYLDVLTRAAEQNANRIAGRFVAKPAPNRGRIFGYGICSRLRDVFTEAGFTDKGADQFSPAALERDPELGETTTWGSHLYLLHGVRLVTFLTAIEVRTC